MAILMQKHLHTPPATGLRLRSFPACPQRRCLELRPHATDELRLGQLFVDTRDVTLWSVRPGCLASRELHCGLKSQNLLNLLIFLVFARFFQLFAVVALLAQFALLDRVAGVLADEQYLSPAKRRPKLSGAVCVCLQDYLLYPTSFAYRGNLALLVHSPHAIDR